MTPARDAGLQGERTALAWSRTVLGLVANALILMRAGMADGQFVLVALGAMLLAAAAATQGFTMHRRRSLLHATVPVAPPPAALLAMAVMTAAAGLGGLLAIAAHLHG